MQQPGESVPSLIDPITYEVFSDPVTASDNRTYERKAIAQWMQRSAERGEPRRSPLTQEAMTQDLKPNGVVKWLVEEAVEMKNGGVNVAVLPASALLVPQEKKRKAQEFGDEDEHEKEPLSIRVLNAVLTVPEAVKDVVGAVPVDAPQLVVMGNESSGKSTLLERITMLPLFPIAPRFCTRMIQKVCLRQGELQVPRVEVHDVRTSPATVKSSVLVPVELAASKIQRIMEREVREENGGRLTGVCRNSMLVVYMQSPTLPNLDVVDLPGFVTNKQEGEPADLAGATRRLVESYLDAIEDAFFLVAIPANSNPSQSVALDIIRQRRLNGSALAVLTKADLLDSSISQKANFGQTLRTKLNAPFPDAASAFPFGCVATMTRPAAAGITHASAYERLKQQAQEEAAWFQGKGFDPAAYDQRVSCDVSILHLAGLYKATLIASDWLKAVVEQLQGHQDILREQEVALGMPRAHDPSKLDLQLLLRESKSLLQRVTPAHLSAPFYRVLSESQFTAQRVWELQAWEYNSMREQLCRDHCEKLKQQVLDCEAVLFDQLLLPLAQDQSPLKMGRFEGVISALQTAAVRIIQAWRKQVSDRVFGMVQQFYALRPSPYFTVAHSLAAGSPVVTLRVDFSRLQDEIVLEALSGLDALYYRLVDRLPHDAHRWLESCAQQRRDLLQAFDIFEAGGWLSAMSSVVNASPVRVRARRVVANASDNGDRPAPTLGRLQSYAQELRSDNPISQLAGMKDMTTLLARNDAPTQQVVDSGVVPRVVELMRTSDDVTLQQQGCLFVSNIANGTFGQKKALVDANTLEVLIALVGSHDKTLRDQAAQALGVVAGECVEFRDRALKAGAVPAVLATLTGENSIAFLRIATRVLRLLSSHAPAPELKLLLAALPHLAQLIMSQDDMVLRDGCVALHNIAHGSNDRIQAVLDTLAGRRVIELLLHPDTSVQSAALAVTGDLCSGNRVQVQSMVNFGVLLALNTLLASAKPGVVKAACAVLLSIAATGDDQIQAAIDAGVFPTVVRLLRASDKSVCEAAIRTISTTMKRGNQAQLSYLVQREHVVLVLTQLLDLDDARICQEVLNSLEALLNAGQRIADTMGIENPYLGALRACGTAAKLDAKSREPTPIGNQAAAILSACRLR